MQTRKHFEIVRQLMRDACNESCIRTPLKFEVDGLKDLCKRNPNIPKVYSKCELAGYAKAANGMPLEPPPIPRPICKSHLNRSQLVRNVVVLCCRIVLATIGIWSVRIDGLPDPTAKLVVCNHVCLLDGFVL
eukprot:scaffold41892_cov78-Phaeocystis_antarctica.AAC.1